MAYLKRTAALACVVATGVFAQSATLDCAAPANAANPACLGLPDPATGTPVTNFVPLVAPGLVAATTAGLAAAVAALGSGGPDTPSTPTTTE